MRGLAIAEKNVIAENADGSFSVPSQSKDGVTYDVRAIGNEWVCSCPDFETRADEIEACKHIVATRLTIAARVELREEPKPKVFADDAIQCGKCGSIRVIKFGNSPNGKQTFRCNDCGYRFREKSLLKGARYSPEMVSLTLDLYFGGMSLRKIARTVNDHFDMTLGSTSIYRWIQAYIPKISEYVNGLAPQLSDTWHADELFVKMKGGANISRAKQDNMAFLWNVMDRKTRFLLASKLSVHRGDYGAVQAFKEATKNAHDSLPERVLTDGLNSYRDPIKFGLKGVQHVARVGINKPHANNNRIERMNGTLRERVKVQRGWKSMKTPLAEGQRLQYNFVKPHMALDGQTPAQAAGIGVEERNKWLELLQKALAKDTTQDGTRA
jgi:transposase-like protein